MEEEINGSGVSWEISLQAHILVFSLAEKRALVNIQMCKSPSVLLEHSRYSVHAGWQWP